jgi:hypothetical protein
LNSGNFSAQALFSAFTAVQENPALIMNARRLTSEILAAPTIASSTAI